MRYGFSFQLSPRAFGVVGGVNYVSALLTHQLTRTLHVVHRVHHHTFTKLGTLCLYTSTEPRPRSAGTHPQPTGGTARRRGKHPQEAPNTDRDKCRRWPDWLLTDPCYAPCPSVSATRALVAISGLTLLASLTCVSSATPGLIGPLLVPYVGLVFQQMLPLGPHHPCADDAHVAAQDRP